MKNPLNPKLTYLIDSMRIIRCPLCGSEKYQTIYEGPVVRGNADLTCVICEHCTHIYLNPCPSLEAYSKFYDEDDYGRFALAVKKKAYAERIHIHDESFFQERAKHGTRLYEKYLKGILTKDDTVFDFGAGDGAWLLGLHKATGCKIDGNEPMSFHVEFIKKRLGIDIFHTPIEMSADSVIKKHGGKIKVVIASDSLEHMVDFMECLRVARSILTDDGYLYICNWDILGRMRSPAPNGRLLKECISIDHPHYFHENSYLFMVQKAGFEILNFEPFSTIRPKPNHMEVFARKAEPSEKASPELSCHQILAKIIDIESGVKRYRTYSPRYHLHLIKDKIWKLTSKLVTGSFMGTN